MTAHSETVDHATLQLMSAAGVITEATLVAEPQGWACVLQVRHAQYPLASKRGDVRHWARIESAIRYLRDIGIVECRIDARAYDPEAIRRHRARPDAREKLTAAHEAAAYDRWFREQVQIGLDDIAAGRVVSHEEVMAEAEQRLEERIARRAN